jgi:hypothetical protein
LKVKLVQFINEWYFELRRKLASKVTANFLSNLKKFVVEYYGRSRYGPVNLKMPIKDQVGSWI